LTIVTKLYFTHVVCIIDTIKQRTTTKMVVNNLSIITNYKMSLKNLKWSGNPSSTPHPEAVDVNNHQSTFSAANLQKIGMCGLLEW